MNVRPPARAAVGMVAGLFALAAVTATFAGRSAAAASTSAVTVQEPSAVVAAASKAMGVENLTSITFYGSGANYGLGQNNDANGPWPRTNLNDYRRTIDFARPASRATAVTHAVPVTGGVAQQGTFNQSITPASTTWAQQLEIWITPWGFLKGAAANGATARVETIDGRRVDVVTWSPPLRAPSGAPYRVVGYIGPEGLVERVETWLEHPIFGDMHVEGIYTHYRDNYGLKYPTTMVQKRGGWPTFDAQILGAHANPANLDQLLTPPAQAGGAPQAPPAATAERLADGVYRITGGYVALAVEFADHIVIFEPAGQNEARAQAVLAEAKRAIPGKPIRYAVLSHHHFDHTGGLTAVVAEGATILTHENNTAFFEAALGAPRTLAPDAMSRSGRRPVIEGVGDLRVLEDAGRRVEIHRIQGLPHADGMLVMYLPKERIIAYADMFNLPPAATPIPDPPVVGTIVFADNIERLGLDVDRVVTVHAPNPDRPITRADIFNSIGRK